MDWWHKMRRVWIAVYARVKTRKAGGGGTCSAGVGGLLKLRDDVQTCGYPDVEVMWNMLSRSQPEEMTTAATDLHNPSKRGKKRSPSRVFSWSHKMTTPPFSSFVN